MLALDCMILIVMSVRTVCKYTQRFCVCSDKMGVFELDGGRWDPLGEFKCFFYIVYCFIFFIYKIDILSTKDFSGTHLLKI